MTTGEQAAARDPGATAMPPAAVAAGAPRAVGHLRGAGRARVLVLVGRIRTETEAEADGEHQQRKHEPLHSLIMRATLPGWQLKAARQPFGRGASRMAPETRHRLAAPSRARRSRGPLAPNASRARQALRNSWRSPTRRVSAWRSRTS